MEMSAIAAVAGTILGYSIAGFFNRSTQKLQLKHDERTKFHLTRFEVYSDFAYSASYVVAAIKAQEKKKQQRLSIAYYRVLIVGSESVRNAATILHSTVTSVHESDDITDNFLDQQFAPALKQFLVETRKELRVDAPTQDSSLVSRSKNS